MIIRQVLVTTHRFIDTYKKRKNTSNEKIKKVRKMTIVV